MTRRGHIVDFNEARASSSRRARDPYARAGARDGATRRPQREERQSDYRRNERSASRFSSFDDSSLGSYGRSLGRKSPSPAGNRSGYVRSVTPSVPSMASSFAGGGGSRSSFSSRGGWDDYAPSAAGRKSSTAQTTPTATTAASARKGGMPSWLSDAYSDLEQVKAQSASAGGGFSARKGPEARTSRFTFDEGLGSGFDSGYSSASGRATSSQRSAGPRRFDQDDRGYAGYDARFDAPAATPRAAVFDEQSLRDEDAPDRTQSAGGGLFGKLKSLKRTADKERAGRKYDREFGDAGSNASNAAPGPRAALTKGEMGSSQRYASRLQHEESAGWGSSAGMSFGGGDRPGDTRTGHAPRVKRMTHPVLKIGAAMLVLVICAGAFMYPTLQTYYQTLRQHDRLEAEYEAVTDRNDALEESINDLQSDDGVAAYAHDQFGWVKSDEQTAVVQGIEVTKKDGLDNVNASVQSGSVKAPETWYSPVLDKVFGVSE